MWKNERLRVDFKKRGAVREMSPRRCGGNQAHFEKEDKPQLQQQIGAFWSVLLSGNQMCHYSKEGDKGLWIE